MMSRTSSPSPDNAMPLSRKLWDILGVVRECGPVTAAEVGGYHLPISAASARSGLHTLEQRGLVAAVYTGRTRRGRAFSLTRRGTAVIESEPGNEDAGTTPAGTPDEHRAQAALAWSRGMLEAMEICNMPGPDGTVRITVADVLEEWRDSLDSPGRPDGNDTARSEAAGTDYTKGLATLTTTTEQEPAAWPEGVIARYRTVGGATVDLTDARGQDHIGVACTGTLCGWEDRIYLEGSIYDTEDETRVRFEDRLPRARRAAQQHAERCRAMLRPASA